MNLFRFAAEEDGPHIAIAPEHLFDIGSVTITNSMVYGWISSILIIGLLIYFRNRITITGSKGIAKLIDAGTEYFVNTLAEAIGSRQKAIKYGPMFVAVFFFIVISNWLGLLPGVGPAIEYNGNPLLRPFTADLNGTLAMGIVMIIIVQYLAISDSGIKKHIRHYFQGSLKNPITIVIGGLEMLGEFTKIISLALRLFLNVVIGEILIAVFAYLGQGAAPLAALPFTLLELFVGLLQGYIFVILCISYLSVATQHSEAHEEHA